MTNTKNETMNAETETNLKLAGALNEIVDLFTQKDKDLSEVERLQMFDDSLGYLCDNLGIDLDMHEELKRGDITLENYEDLRKLDKEEQDEPQNVVTLADELKELYSLNDSMFTSDPNHVPTYADGTVIRQQDLADMNMNGLQRIAEMIGIELGE
ncbi:MAG: Phage protein [Lactococcus sp.]